MAIGCFLLKNSSNPAKSPVANMLVLASMNGNTDLLTVKFETVNKYFASVRDFIHRLFGMGGEDQFDLQKIATRLDDLYSEENLVHLENNLTRLNKKISTLRTTINRFQSTDSRRNKEMAEGKTDKVEKLKSELLAEVETIAMAAYNLRLYTKRQSKNGQAPQALETLTQVSSRLTAFVGTLQPFVK